LWVLGIAAYLAFFPMMRHVDSIPRHKIGGTEL
jgi:hypothetical protein